MNSRPFRLALLALLGASSLAVSQPPGPTSASMVHWVAAMPGGVKRGGTANLELSGEILHGWHVYALTQPPGGPTGLRITVDDNNIVELAGSPSGPAPRKHPDPSFGLVSEIYTDAVTVRLPVLVKQQSAAGRQSVPISVRFQTCSDRECQPPTTIHLSVPIEVLPDA